MTRSRLARRSLPALIFTIFLAACGSSTSTPAVDAKQFQQRLDQLVTAITAPQPDAEFTAKAEGKATVEVKDDGSVVGTLPRLTFTSAEGTKATLDPITLRFVSTSDGQTPFEATIPSSMSVKDKDGKVVGQVTIGGQTLKGVWVEKLQTIDPIDMRLSNIVITSPGEEGSGRIDQISLAGKLQAKGSALYDGKYDMRIAGFRVDDPAEKTTIKMASLSVTAAMIGARMEDWAKAAKEAGYTLANPDVFKAWTGGPIDPKMIAFLKRMPEFMGNVDYVYAVNGIEAAQNGKTQFTLKNTSFGFGAAGDGKGTTKLRMSLGVGGMAGGAEDPMLPPEADIQDASLEVEASGLPGQKLWEIYLDALPKLQSEAAKMAGQTATGAPGASEAATTALEEVGMELSAKFMEVLSAAKLAIALNKLNLITPTAKMTGKGMATYLPAQQMMPEGKVALRFSGVDKLASAMEKRGPDDEMAQQIMGVLAAVRAMGKPDPTSPASDRTYIIDIEFRKDGKVLANGQDMLGGP